MLIPCSSFYEDIFAQSLTKFPTSEWDQPDQLSGLINFSRNTRPGKHTKKLLNMAIEIVDLPSKNCDVP